MTCVQDCQREAELEKRIAELEKTLTSEYAWREAWLIEMDDGGRPTYWSRVDDEDGVCGWSNDHEKAIRFCRSQDAKAIIDEHGWTEPKPVEHAWDTIPFRHSDVAPDLK